MKGSDYTVKGYSLKEMRNDNERSVCRLMDKIIDREEYAGMCLCGVCMEDIYGLALNNLPPRYKHSRTIKLKDKKLDLEIENAIQEAIKIVKRSPNHS